MSEWRLPTEEEKKAISKRGTDWYKEKLIIPGAFISFWVLLCFLACLVQVNVDFSYEHSDLTYNEMLMQEMWETVWALSWIIFFVGIYFGLVIRKYVRLKNKNFVVVSGKSIDKECCYSRGTLLGSRRTVTIETENGDTVVGRVSIEDYDSTELGSDVIMVAMPFKIFSVVNAYLGDEDIYFGIIGFNMD